MRRAALVAGVAIALTGYATPAISQDVSPEATPPDPCQSHPHPAAEQRRLAHRVFDLRRWRKPKPSADAVAQMQELRRCASPKALPAMRRSWRDAKRRLYRHRAYRRIAPYRGFSGEGYWLRWLPIPRYIIECETNGYWGEGRWQAANGSGANGPAQLLGWGQPYPATSDRERLTYWKITRMVWTNYGASQWACA